MIKNKYTIINNTVHMDVWYKDQCFTCLFDGDDLELISSYGATWRVKFRNGKVECVYCTKGTKEIRNTVYMHRVIMGNPNGKIVDHKDINPLNNKKGNLRVCTIQENSCNANKRRHTKGKKPTSKYKGVYLYKGRFVVNVRSRDKGIFTNEIAAANFYNHLAKIEFGEFANLNNVEFMSIEECEEYRCKRGKPKKVTL